MAKELLAIWLAAEAAPKGLTAFDRKACLRRLQRNLNSIQPGVW